MNIQIITSSYPATPNDPSGTAGLFVRDFALQLALLKHTVILQPVARKQTYQADPGLIIEPIPWKGGDQELASLNFYNPKNWSLIMDFLETGKKQTLEIHRKYQVDRTLCMWAVPSGYFGYHIHQSTGSPYDIWALGSDIWKFGKIPFIGKYFLRKIIGQANRCFADGLQLGKDVEKIAKKKCLFLASSRTLPPPENGLAKLNPVNKKHFLFVGRYHKNKGPDLLLKAALKLPDHIQNQIHIHMFGLGPLKKSLEQFILDHQLSHCVSLNGPIDAQQLSNYLTRIDFLLIPSRIESIPVIFSDAMQMQTPVVSTPVGDLTRLIQKFSCGLIAQSITSKAIANSIHNALENGPEIFLPGSLTAQKAFSTTESVSQWL